jgi:hypothetical protein
MSLILTGLEVSILRACLRELVTAPRVESRDRDLGIVVFQGLPKFAKQGEAAAAPHMLADAEIAWCARAAAVVLEAGWRDAEFVGRIGTSARSLAWMLDLLGAVCGPPHQATGAMAGAKLPDHRRDISGSAAWNPPMPWTPAHDSMRYSSACLAS